MSPRKEPLVLRPRVSDSDAKKIIDSLLPDLHSASPDEYTELWEEVVAGSGETTFSKAAARLDSWHPDLAIELHKLQPWVPSNDEMQILSPFFLSLMRGVIVTFRGKNVVKSDAAELSDEFLAHAVKMLADVRSKVRLYSDASKPEDSEDEEGPVVGGSRCVVQPSSECSHGMGPDDFGGSDIIAPFDPPKDYDPKEDDEEGLT